ncbi:MAG: molybdopterin-binding protein [Caldisericaceae bacterium]
MFKKVKIEKAVGMVLGADVTKIIPNEYKGALFKKGHLIEEKDIEELRKVGKEYIWVYNENPSYVHQDYVSIEIAKSLISENLYVSGPSEGWAYINAKKRGILVVNEKAVKKLNLFKMVVLTTVKNYSLVSKDTNVSKFKVTRLEISNQLYKKIFDNASKLKMLDGFIFDVVKPLYDKASVIVTGNEVYEGLVPDAASPKLKNKLPKFGVEVIFNKLVPDSENEIEGAIEDSIKNGANIIILTGGMGPDPDDATRNGIKKAHGKIIRYGVPVNPATMSLIAWIKDIPVLGISAGFINYENSFLDFVLPGLLAGERITKSKIASWGVGGMLEQK